MHAGKMNNWSTRQLGNVYSYNGVVDEADAKMGRSQSMQSRMRLIALAGMPK